jgi:hypothetical protein
MYDSNSYIKWLFKEILLAILQNILSLILIKILYNITSYKMHNSSLNNGSVKGNN